jgi:hypothetical protein
MKRITRQELALHQVLRDSLRVKYTAIETFTVHYIATVTCDACGETISSFHRHDFETCACGAVSVDGGVECPRRVFTPGAQWEEWLGAEARDVADAALFVRMGAAA